MNLRERMLATVRGERADRVPLWFYGFDGFRNREEIEELTDSGRKEIAQRLFDRSAVVIRHPSHINRFLVTPPQFIRRVNLNVAKKCVVC